MILKNKQGLEIEVEITIEDYNECFIQSGVYVETGLEASDSVLDALQETYADRLEQYALECAMCYAESVCEGDR